MRNLYLTICALSSLLFALSMSAQTRIISVEPLLGSLNTAIDGDTTETGERIDPDNTVYELQGGQLYPLIRTIENSGYPLYIRTNPADDERALLQPFASGGGEAGRAFEARGDLKIEGIRVRNVDQLGGIQTRIIRARQDGIRVTVDNCWLEVDGQTALRLDQNDTRIFISNSIISNIGLWNDPDNGRLIDDRGNDVDSIEVYNTLVYNVTSRILRDGGGVTNWAHFDQNTFVNAGQRGLEFGFTREAVVTNNMITNVGLRGKGEGASQAFVEIEQWIGDGDQVLVVSNNNLFFTQDVLDLYPAERVPINLLDSLGTAIIDNEAMIATNTEEVVSYNDPSPTPLQWVSDFFADNIANTPPAYDTDLLTYDFFYPNTFESFTGGSNGQPIGILPADFGIFVNNARKEIDFSIYPNPTSDMLFVDLPSDAGIQSIKVFSIIGSEVAAYSTISSGIQSLNVGSLPSGIYMLTVIDGSGSQSTRKFVKQ